MIISVTKAAKKAISLRAAFCLAGLLPLSFSLDAELLLIVKSPKFMGGFENELTNKYQQVQWLKWPERTWSTREHNELCTNSMQFFNICNTDFKTKFLPEKPLIPAFEPRVCLSTRC